MDMPTIPHAVVGDQPGNEKLFMMATCPTCGGRGGFYDSQGNWYPCPNAECDGGQVPG